MTDQLTPRVQATALGTSAKFAVHTRSILLSGYVLTSIACTLSWSVAAQERKSLSPVVEDILSSTEWKEYTERLAENYLGPVDALRLERNCRESIPPNSIKADSASIEDCLRGAAAGLEFATEYISIADTEKLHGQARQRFVGIGLEVTQRDGLVSIVRTIEGSPAEKSGLKSGDLILSLDDKTVRGLSLTDSVRLMRGESGTDLKLVVVRSGSPAQLTFVVMREDIKPLSVRSRWLHSDVAYLRISQFRDETRNELIAAVQKLKSNGPPTAVVLDLRGCPGGLLDATVDISSLFVPVGAQVLATRGRKAGVTRTYEASMSPDVQKKVPWEAEPSDWPLRRTRVVVLIDRRTGGGAEALAALLKEARGASIVGETSAGFGIMQTIFRLKSGASVRIATALMTPPSGRGWNGAGIEPDVLSSPDREKWELGDVDVDAQLRAAVSLVKTTLPRRAEPAVSK